MKTALIACMLIIFSCSNPEQKESPEINKTSTIDASASEKKPIETKKIEEEPLVADTGQIWFKVSVTKNDTPYVKYEGDWPVLLTTKNFATLALTASKGALVVSHGLTFYMYDWPMTGRLPIVRSAQTKGDINMIMVPVENGAYGLAISPDTGFVNMTKNDGKIMSGHFEARATNANKDIYWFKGQFMNVKPH